MIALGKECYHEINGAIHGYGRKWSEKDLSSALGNEVADLVYDESGNEQIRSILAGVVATEFEKAELEKVLASADTIKDWQVGEAIAECYLSKHRNCLFPWPDGRDVRRPKSSLPGADLVGLIGEDGETRFVFGEVKTSTEKKWPPQVCGGRSKGKGLGKQVRELCCDENIKNRIFLYLGHRAGAFAEQYKVAARHFLIDRNDVHVVGFLVRDVEPKPEDLKSLVKSISSVRSEKTSVEFWALYLPNGKINTLAESVSMVRKGGAA